jgi:hypothetical protein
MFGTQIVNRTARGMAVGALILSFTVTTFAGSAHAAPLAENDCSAAAHARNDAVHLLHTAWKAFDGDLKDLAKDARQLQHESHKSGMVLTKDARAEIASAKQDLKEIASQAHEDIQAAVELGSACKDANEDENSTTTTTTTTTTNTSTTAPSDSTAPADSTGSAHSFDTSGLHAKYKDIVDQAIKDMQGVVDGARKALLDMTAVVEAKATNEDSDDSKVEKVVENAKADREKAKEERVKAKDDRQKAAKNKATTKSQNSGKGNGKSKDND